MSSNKGQGGNKPEKIEYEYFRDTEGRLKRYRKQDYQPRPGYIRFKFLEKYYIWWKRKSFDFKIAIMPWFVGFTGVFIIYQCSMIWSQNDLEREIKSRLNFEYNQEVIDEMKRIHKGIKK